MVVITTTHRNKIPRIIIKHTGLLEQSNEYPQASLNTKHNMHVKLMSPVET